MFARRLNKAAIKLGHSVFLLDFMICRISVPFISPCSFLRVSPCFPSLKDISRYRNSVLELPSLFRLQAAHATDCLKITRKKELAENRGHAARVSAQTRTATSAGGQLAQE